ncbi:MAG: GNAT family N-acetyltransferase [Algibacter sp.]
MELEKIYLLPKYKRKGLGKFEFSSIIENQKEKDVKTILLDMVDTNISSIQFHETLGFKTIRKTVLKEPFFKDELRGMLIMELSLL